MNQYLINQFFLQESRGGKGGAKSPKVVPGGTSGKESEKPQAEEPLKGPVSLAAMMKAAKQKVYGIVDITPPPTKVRLPPLECLKYTL